MHQPQELAEVPAIAVQKVIRHYPHVVLALVDGEVPFPWVQVDEADVEIAIRRGEAPGPAAALAGVADLDALVVLDLGEEVEDGWIHVAIFERNGEGVGKVSLGWGNLG